MPIARLYECGHKCNYWEDSRHVKHFYNDNKCPNNDNKPHNIVPARMFLFI